MIVAATDADRAIPRGARRLTDLDFVETPVTWRCDGQSDTHIELHAILLRDCPAATIVRSTAYGHPNVAAVTNLNCCDRPHSGTDGLDLRWSERETRRRGRMQQCSTMLKLPESGLVAVIRGHYDLPLPRAAPLVLWYSQNLLLDCWHRVSDAVDQLGDLVICNFIGIALVHHVEREARP